MDAAICCPRFDPACWQEATHDWENKRFIKAKVFTAFYVPLNFGRVIRALDQRVRNAGATISDGLCLSDHTSKWNMDLYLAVDKEIPGADNVTMLGTFLTKVYEGPFKDTGQWCADFAAFAEARSFSVGKLYMWYTTCPKCAKKYGKNYVVIVGKSK